MRTSLILVVVVSAAALAWHAGASAAAPSRQDGAMAMPVPGPEMKALEGFVGIWDADVDMMGQKQKGRETAKFDFGGFWLVQDFSGEMMGQPFKGHGLVGYDPMKKKYVSTWVDSTSPFLMIAEGLFSDDGKTLTTTGDGVDMEGKPARYRDVSRFIDANTREFEMFQVGADGKEQPLMKIVYKKAK